MPENFPAQAVAAKLAAARLRVGGKRQSGTLAPCLIGDLARFFHELAKAIANVDSSALAALRPAVEKLLGSMAKATNEIGPEVPVNAPWPTGRQAEILKYLQEIKERLNGEQERAADAETQERLEMAEASLLSLVGEADRPRPAWHVMATESRELRGYLRTAPDPGSVRGQMMSSAQALFDRLGEVAEDVISSLPDLAPFQDHSDTPALAIIPAGAFLMGSPKNEEGRFDDEGPRHEVTFARRFALGRYPVTFDEYDRFTDATGRTEVEDEGWGRGRRPVINVTWRDAEAYVTWLSQETGKPYRLPSEAEWEYACRAGTTTRYSWGDDITPENANYDQNVGKTTEVDGYAANSWGLYGMHGNVWEWCGDHWNETYEGAPDDGRVWTQGGSDRRVLRGGSWVVSPRDLRSAFRLRSSADDRYVVCGFRVARTLR